MTTDLAAISAWAQAHPTVIVLGAWFVLNVLWAQLPARWFQNPTANRVLSAVHAMLQLVVTHSSMPGTFTWPSIVRLALTSLGGETARVVPEVPLLVPAPPPPQQFRRATEGCPACVGSAPSALKPTVELPSLIPEQPSCPDAETPVDVPHPQHTSEAPK